MPASRKVKPLTRDPFAARVAAYVNQQFGGNVSSAAAAIGCTYDALYHAARGSRRPSADFLVKLYRQSGKSIDWWLTGEDA